MLALALVLPAHALASGSMDSSLMDDQELIYSAPAQVQQAMDQIAALGVNRIKVSMVWSLVAPDPYSTQRPNFDATDPNAYPQGNWTRYDTLVRLAQQLGISVYFQIDPPAPDWAIPANELGDSKQYGRAPNPTDFEQFVAAVGKRYSGSFAPASPTPPSAGPPPIQIPGLPPIALGGGSTQQAPPQQPLPRVSYWSIWNEPNIPAWLNPWYTSLPGGGTELLEPSLYRGLLNAAWDGLEATGHTPATDTILIGETANSGAGSVSAFIHDLYCVGPKLKLLRGSLAQRYGCPTSGSRASFVQANPGLFSATGFAHHPYSFNEPPNVRYPLRSWYTLYNLGSLEKLLNSILGSYGRRPRGGEPLYLTEFGYESDPPNPFVKNSTTQQATWLNESEYMAWRYPYVGTLTQFELMDSAPTNTYKQGSYAYWTTSFQTGLEFLGGQPKPAFAAYRIPIWLPVARHGRRVAIWGQLRPADHSQPQYAVIELERAGSHGFQQLREVETTSSQGFLVVDMPLRSAGLVRIAWLDPSTGVVDYSRDVSIS
jgi:hypothetical protein